MNKTYIALALVLVAGLAVASLGSALAQNYSGQNSTSTSGSNSSLSTTGTSTAANSTTSTANQTSSSTNATGDTFTAYGNIASVIYPQSTPSSTSTSSTGSSNATGTTTTSNSTASGTNSTSGNAFLGSSASNATSSTSLPSSENSSAPSTAQQANSTSSGSLTNSTSSGANTTSSTVSSPAPSAATSLPYILSGNWSLSVQNGKVSNFSSKFVMVHTDGTGRHTHDFSNFTAKSTPITLNSPIVGTADIAVNGTVQFKGVNIVIMIEHNNVATMAVDSHATDNHFGGQPIYVVLNSFKGQNGTEQIQSAGTSTSSTGIGQSVSQGLSSAYNGTSSFLSNASKSFTGLFNKTK